MLEITNAEASANILRFADEGRLTQAKWHGRGDDGREIACLLGAIDSSVTSPKDCNGKLMPMWLADLTPTLFDGIPPTAIVPVARRYGALVARWGSLSPETWDRISVQFRICCIDNAVTAARRAEGQPYWPAVNDACEQVKAALKSSDKAALDAAEAAAEAAARAAAWAAEAEAYFRLFTFLLDQIEAECDAA